MAEGACDSSVLRIGWIVSGVREDVPKAAYGVDALGERYADHPRLPSSMIWDDDDGDGRVWFRKTAVPWADR